ncbi:SA1362 family protein [Salinicoccus siamensis]|uniref:SA1362 family protein n=1 Tax=Salinicoccus siamensis TaxID=381830 RepID=A0ABV5Z1H0_9STAP
MKRFLMYLVLAIAAIGLVTNLDYFMGMILNSLVTLLIIGLILYGIYYFFILTPSQRKYKRALRKSKRKYRNRK